MKHRIFWDLAALSLSLLACAQENPVEAPVEQNDGKMVITASFEKWTDSKTYVVDGTAVHWGTAAADKVIYVFDAEGAKHAFTSTATAEAATRSFTGDLASDADVQYVLWSGKVAADDVSALVEAGGTSSETIPGNNEPIGDGGTIEFETKADGTHTVIGGLSVVNPQNIIHTNSFAQDANISVMKPGNTVLRSVFGFVRFTVSAGDGGHATIKSVTFSADENLAGDIQVDYNGSDPVTSIVANGSKSLTVNMHQDGSDYEAGTLYAVLPAGTYHNFKVSVTPVTGAAYSLSAKNDVVIKRGQFTDAGTLSAPEGSVWPSDAAAFDAALAPGEPRTAKLIASELEEFGIVPSDASKRAVTGLAVTDGVTYGGPGMTCYGNRMTTDKVNNQWSTEYPEVIPSACFFSFKINRPGSIRFYGAPSSKDGDVVKIPTYYLAVVTKVGGVTSAKIVQSVTPTEVADGTDSENRKDTNINSEAWAKYWVTMTVSRDDLEGIEEAATVYLYHRYSSGSCSVHYWPITWTSALDNPPLPGHKPKFLLAGDSTCATKDESYAPQQGWGQRLAEALGSDAKVENHAVGGESTKTFLDTGKWNNLRTAIVAGDIVIIQFGHNDSGSKEERHTEPYGSYQDNLRTMMNDVLAKGGIPVLATSIYTRSFDSSNKPTTTISTYVQAMRDLATETGTRLIDVHAMTYQWLLELGPDGSAPYYITDNTHLTGEGAQAIAGMVAQGLKTLGLWE